MPKRNKTNICNKDDFKDLINKELIEQLDEKKCELILYLQKFNNDCYEINCLLSDFNYIRVYELKNKFRHLMLKEPKKKNIVGQISSCIIEKYNGYQASNLY